MSETLYRVVWHTEPESGHIQSGLLVSWEAALYDWAYLIHLDRTAWIEDAEHNKIEITPEAK